MSERLNFSFCFPKLSLIVLEAIGEELGFDDVHPHNDVTISISRRSTRSASIKSHGSDDAMNPAHRTLRFPGSPGGSLESSSAVSRGSFRSRKSFDR